MDATRQALIDAIYGQESSHGKADTSQENYATARGPMQVTKSTFEGLKNKGLIPATFDHANPQHGYQAGVALINYLSDKYGNDPVKVAAAYYAGEKAVRADGSIADFRDLKNPKAPTTHQYVQQVLTRMGGDAPDMGDGGLAPSGEPVTPRANVLDSWTEGFGPRPDKIGPLKALPPNPAIADTALPQGPGTAGAEAQAAADANQRQAQEVLDTSFIDTSRRVFMHNTFVGNVLKQVARDSFGDPVKGYAVDPKLYDGLSHAEQSALSEATNDTHRDRILAEIHQRREDMRVAELNGPWVTTAASILGGLPEGYVTGAAGSLGAIKAAAQFGVRSRAGLLGLAAAENIGGNVALTAAQATIDPYTGLEDVPMAVGMGVLGTAMHLPGLGRESDKAHIAFQANKIMREAAETAERYKAKAEANLGEGATREQVQAEINRLQADDLKAKTQAAMAPVNEQRRMLPPEETVTHEAPVAVKDMTLEDNSLPSVTGHEALLAEPGKMSDYLTMPEADFNAKWGSDVPVKWTTGEFMSPRAMVEKQSGVKFEDVRKLSSGVHYLEGTAGISGHQKHVIEWLQKHFLPDHKILIRDLDTHEPNARANGDAQRLWDKTVLIRTRFGAGKEWQHTIVHEFGHAIQTKFADVPDAVGKAFLDLHAEWQAHYTGAFPTDRITAAQMRGSSTNHAARQQLGVKDPVGFRASMMDVMSGVVQRMADGIQKPSAENLRHGRQYIPNADEFTAEQFTKYIEAAIAKELNWKPTSIPQALVDYAKEMWNTFKQLFDFAKENKLIKPDERAVDFFESIRKQAKASVTKEKRAAAGLNPERDTVMEAPVASQSAPAPVDIDTKYGLDLMPQDTPQAKAEYKAVRFLYEKADAWAAANPKDESKLSKLMDTAVFQNGQSITSVMLRSDNPVVRMIASELMESASGASGRRSTAAIAKFLHERAFVGNTVNEFQGAYKVWRQAEGGNVVDDFTNGRLWHQYNRLVAEEIENRRAGVKSEAHPAIVDGANRLEAAYERMRIAQQTAKTVGWGALPESSVGYMPHRLSSEKVRQLTNEQKGALHSALVDQFISIEGFDISFSANLASKYIDRIQRRALGGTEAPANIHQTGAADVVEEALKQMGMTPDEVQASMQRYMKGGASHTKQRLKLDLNQVHEGADGQSFRLLDLFETDQLNLLRSQAGRVSGEVALAGHGIMGKPGLALLKRALDFGETNGKVQGHEAEAFDQMAAEFLGDPFGTAHSAKWMNRAMQVTSLARLGGMGFTQLAESINAIAHVGASRALAAVGGLNRLRREAAALARGETVENPLLKSIEDFSGVTFGTDNRKLVFPFDNQTLQYQSYGKDTVTMADRMLRGATHLQGKLSLWQAIHGAQQRGMAEAIISKSMEYIRAGKNDVALRDMGISDELAAKLRGSLNQAAVFDASGKLTSFDVTKIEDTAAANEFIQAIHRGTAQIIQETFIGERGKWAHDAVARVFTQFRTFSITSVEKQWGRQVNNHGTAKALGIMLGSMSVAAPIYIARTYAQSVGRPDQQAYLDKALTPYAIARATMNYVAASGLAGDFLDAATAVVGKDMPGGQRGTSAAAKSFVGNVIAPSAGLIDDAWKAAQNTKEGTSPHDLLKVLPFSSLPVLGNAVNSLGR